MVCQRWPVRAINTMEGSPLEVGSPLSRAPFLIGKQIKSDDTSLLSPLNQLPVTQEEVSDVIILETILSIIFYQVGATLMWPYLALPTLSLLEVK